MIVMLTYVAISFISICLIDSFKYRCIFSIIWACIFRNNIVKKYRLLSYLLLLLLIICSIRIKTDYFYSGRVDSIKENYIIVKDNNKSLIVYTKSSVQLDDYVMIDQEVKEIVSSNNFNTSTFTSWAKGNNIVGYVNIDEIEIIKPSTTLRSYIMKNNQKNQNLWANDLLFGSGIDVNSDYKYLFVQSGLHISFFSLFLTNFVSLFLYQEESDKIVTLILIIVASVLGFPYSFIRIIMGRFCKLLFKQKRKALMIEIILMCLYRPYYVMSVSFLIPIGLKLISVYSYRFNKTLNYLYLVFIQLLFYGKCNLISILLFRVIRYISALLYLLSLIVWLIPIKIPLDNVLIKIFELVDLINPLNIIGKPMVIIIILFIYFMLMFTETNSKKYLVFLVVLLIVNHNMRLLIPFYTLTQLDVGQGDCAVLTIPFSKKALMIDTGGSVYKDVGKSIVIPYLESIGVKEVEIIISHEDYDHYGALNYIKKNITVTNVYKDKVEELKVNKLSIYNPLWDKEYVDNNENSLVSYFKIGNFYFLYLADVTSKVENDLIEKYPNMVVDVCKLSHHGSITGTSEELVDNYRFSLALISAGKNNERTTKMIQA